MKKTLIVFGVSFALLMGSLPAFADGCYICKGGSYVKFSGSDDQSKRKQAKNCGCEITGTRGSCDAANLKVLCTVQVDQNENVKLACDDKKHDDDDEG